LSQPRPARRGPGAVLCRGLRGSERCLWVTAPPLPARDGVQALRAAWDGVDVIEAWRRHYNEVRPHSSLGHLTPTEFIAKEAKGISASVLQWAGTLRYVGHISSTRSRSYVMA
jgi:hypothetical protein